MAALWQQQGDPSIMAMPWPQWGSSRPTVRLSFSTLPFASLPLFLLLVVSSLTAIIAPLLAVFQHFVTRLAADLMRCQLFWQRTQTPLRFPVPDFQEKIPARPPSSWITTSSAPKPPDINLWSKDGGSDFVSPSRHDTKGRRLQLK